MSQITITKKNLTEGQKLLISNMGFKATDLLDSYYELTPHEGSFSNPITLEPNSNAKIMFKFPDWNNLSSKRVDMTLGDTPLQTDSFSNLVVGELAPTFVVGSSFSDNPNFLYHGVAGIITDVYSADSDYVTIARRFQEACSEISPYVTSVPYQNRVHPGAKAESAQTVETFNISTSANDRPYNFTRTWTTSTSSLVDYLWPLAFWGLKMNINKASNVYDKQTLPYKMKNLMYKAVFESFGWSERIISTHYYQANFAVAQDTLAGGNRTFCTNPAVLAKYREFSCINEVSAVPMSKIKQWYFADGYDADSINGTVFDFYFADGFVGGPGNQPIPHPALHREVLAYNEKNGLSENYYRRAGSLVETYKAPGYIVTKEAMQMLGVQFDGGLDNGLDDVRISHYHPGTQTVEIGNTEADIDDTKDIRTFTNEKYLIKTTTGVEESRNILCFPNRTLPYSQGYDKSVKQALRYFGFVPYGDLENIGASQIGLLGKRAVVIEDGQVVDQISNMTEPSTSRTNYNFYISANRSFDHVALGYYTLGSMNDALGKLFNAEVKQVIFCVGDDPVDVLEQDTTRSNDNIHNYRYILVRKERG